MTTRLTIYGGTDWSDGEVLYAADLNATIKAADGALGEVRMFGLSMTGATTKAALQTRGWAICDGTTPAVQGISSPTIETTPNLENKFIRASDDETSGTTAGSDTHQHQWINDDGSSAKPAIEMDASVSDRSSKSWDDNASLIDLSETSLNLDGDYYTNNASTLPAYYELAFFMKVKI